MSRTDEPPPRNRSTRLRAALRWLVAGSIGVLTTLSIFAVMAFSVDVRDIVERMFRIFPLTRTEISAEDDCPTDGSDLPAPVIIEGVVGQRQGGAFQPLPDIEVLGDDSVSRSVAVEVSAAGEFRFATTFPSEAPPPCGGTEYPTGGKTQRLLFRAPGCAERRVPVTRTWVPHRIILICPSRRGPPSPARG